MDTEKVYLATSTYEYAYIPFTYPPAPLPPCAHKMERKRGVIMDNDGKIWGGWKGTINRLSLGGVNKLVGESWVWRANKSVTILYPFAPMDS